MQVRPGDTVLLYTGGLVEQERDIVRGFDGLLAAAEARCPAGVEDLLDHVLAKVNAGRGWRDDTLLLAVRWHGGPA